MSPNMELVRRWYALLPSLGGTDPNDDSAFFDRMFRDYLDEEYELRLPGGYPEGEPAFRGREGLAQLLAMLRDSWAEWRFEPDRFIDAGDQVVVFVARRGQGQRERSADRAARRARRDPPRRSFDVDSRLPRSLGGPRSRRTPGLNQGPQRGIRSSGKLIETV
jgi:ketosteroid isomerase-like protein